MQSEKIHTESLNSFPKPLEIVSLVIGDPYDSILENGSTAFVRLVTADTILFDLVSKEGHIFKDVVGDMLFLEQYTKSKLKRYDEAEGFVTKNFRYKTFLYTPIPFDAELPIKDERIFALKKLYKVVEVERCYKLLANPIPSINCTVAVEQVYDFKR